MVDSLVNSLQETKTNAEIELEAEIEDGEAKVDKKVEGTLSAEQESFVTQLEEGLSATEDKVKIKIETEFEGGDGESEEEDEEEDDDEE